MSVAASPSERALANQIVAISVSDSPDLGRLGLLDRNLKQTVSALATRLVCHGARIAYGGNLDRSGFTYQLYPAIAQAYATAALRSAQPPFVHYVAAYMAQDAAKVADHLQSVARFAEVRLVDRARSVTDLLMRGPNIVSGVSGIDESLLADIDQLLPFVEALPRDSGGQATDLDIMREAMEDAVSARIVIGGRVVGYSGGRPGVLQEVLLALRKQHPLIPLGGFGGAARDAAIALGLMPNDDRLPRDEVGPGYWETVAEIATHAGEYRQRAEMVDAWHDLVAASRAEDAEVAATNVMRVLIRFADKAPNIDSALGANIMNAKTKPEPTPDQAAAHQFLSELRTRITTQTLPYQYGVEARALESLWEVFAQARTAMKDNPGCEKFAEEVTQVLNLELRPVTAKWHRAHKEGRLNSRDGSNEFREDLADVQKELRACAERLHLMAYGTAGKIEDTPLPIKSDELTEIFQDVPFGIAKIAIQQIPDATVDEINKAESAAVKRRRGKHGIKTADIKNAVGYGLSGGGIRSAAFCLGVTQVLADRKLLKDVDFLSTVSGGGYMGSFLTRRIDSADLSNVAAPHGPDPDPVRYLRQHAKFLTAIDLKERWSMVTATLAGLILNWTAPLFLLAVAALAAHGLGKLFPDPPWLQILAGLGAVTGFALLVYAGLMRVGTKVANWSGRFLGVMAALTLFVAFCWLLVAGYGSFKESVGGSWGIAGFIAAVAAAFPTIVRFIPILKKPTVRKWVLKIALLAAGLIIPIGAIALFYLLCYLGTQVGLWALWVIAVVCAIVAWFLLNINLTGPHRLYRDALDRAFIQYKELDREHVPLKDINAGDFAPYHLINTTLNIPSSTHEALRERKSDFFLFSKYWCGAPSVGYQKTENWKANNKDADLATAMAVSGAAASSYMGLGSMPTLTALLTFLNVRLGFWIKRPEANDATGTPGFMCLLREMTGIAMSEKYRWLNLSDGGHIENMGIYELLRRRCKFIISVDGEADPESTFQGHLTLVRHALIDFGITIDPRLNELRPDPTSKFSQSHAMLCRVHYPAQGGMPAGMGLILYLKLSVTGNEPELIRRYRTLNADFPHQSTLDQFFDQEQFECYRRLGVHVAEGLFSRAILGQVDPQTVHEWFAELAKNLLEPRRS